MIKGNDLWPRDNQKRMDKKLSSIAVLEAILGERKNI